MTALWPANEQSIMIHEICAAYSSVVVFLNKDYCHMLIYNPYNHQSMPLWTAEPLQLRLKDYETRILDPFHCLGFRTLMTAYL